MSNALYRNRQFAECLDTIRYMLSKLDDDTQHDNAFYWGEIVEAAEVGRKLAAGEEL